MVSSDLSTKAYLLGFFHQHAGDMETGDNIKSCNFFQDAVLVSPSLPSEQYGTIEVASCRI